MCHELGQALQRIFLFDKLVLIHLKYNKLSQERQRAKQHILTSSAQELYDEAAEMLAHKPLLHDNILGKVVKHSETKLQQSLLLANYTAVAPFLFVVTQTLFIALVRNLKLAP
jgi:hypothetical protein